MAETAPGNDSSQFVAGPGTYKQKYYNGNYFWSPGGKGRTLSEKTSRSRHSH